MDLDFLGYPYHSSFLIDKYVEKSGDTEIFNVLNFYKCYRAYVRGKVTGFKLNDPNIDDLEKNVIITTAKKYFDLAYYYAQLFSLDLIEEKRPILFITTGLTGTGKTTAARKISIDYHADLISTDTVRKELEGIDKYERHHDAYNTGLYSPDKMQETYEIIIERAKDLLIKGYNVVLDATFKTEELRNKAEDITKETNTRFLIIYTKCPESVVKKYLEQRVKKKSISDGRWEIYVKQKDSFEKIKNKPFVELDISNNSYDYQIKVFRSILNKIINGEIHDN
jgi:predicted kinase